FLPFPNEPQRPGSKAWVSECSKFESRFRQKKLRVCLSGVVTLYNVEVKRPPAGVVQR
ncbi:hypothetical protein AVEN_188507-1, partial [Araneus ventricosus]